ncbi:MAG: NlpC/P60 family protein, partial [Corynebacterium variabile]
NATRTATVENLQTSLSDAAASKSLALRSKATADFQLSEFGQRQADLDARTAELDAMKDQISEAVDAMPQDQKQRWIDRNGPIDVDVEEFLNEASALAGGVVGAAMSKLGSPYSWGATGPDAFDCSGLMFWAYQQMGKSIPRTSSAQIAGGTPVSREQLQPGDIVGYYSGVSHVGMYIGDGKIVHASDYGIPVQVVSVDSMPFAGASRY